MGSNLRCTQRERQAQRVPFAVLVERAALERHVGHVAVGVADGRGVVGVVGEGDSDGTCREAEDRSDIVATRLSVGVPIRFAEEPTLFRTGLRSRPIAAVFVKCRAASIGNVGIHIGIAGFTVIVALRRAEVGENGIVVTLLRHAPVRHCYHAQRGVACEVASGIIVGPQFQRGAGVAAHRLPTVDGIPRLRCGVLQGEDEAVARRGHLA